MNLPKISYNNLSIPGLLKIENFISLEEEHSILNEIYKNEWQTSIKRRVQHYGNTFDYNTLKLNDIKCSNFPTWLNIIIDKILKLECCKNFRPDQCTINEYMPGIGIAQHIDTHSCFTDTIISLSLENDIVMQFKNKNSTEEKQSLYLPSRSLLILQQESRYCYAHSIAYRKTDIGPNGDLVKRAKRVSITLRQTNNIGCNCKWNNLCDSRICH